MEDDEDEELIGEEGAELIGADDAAPAKKGLLGKCLPKKKGKKAKYGEAGPSGAKRRKPRRSPRTRSLTACRAAARCQSDARFITLTLTSWPTCARTNHARSSS